MVSIPWMQRWFNVRETMWFITSTKPDSKNHMISIDIEKACDKNSVSIYNHTQWCKAEHFPFKIRNKTKMPILTTTIQYGGDAMDCFHSCNYC